MAARKKKIATKNASRKGIETSILEIRGQRVLLDNDLASLYGVTTKRLNEQVTRNADRFPVDFAFRLSPQEVADLRSQFATSSWGGRRHPPRVFREHGAVMAASVLNSSIAVDMSVQVVRAFVRMRRLMVSQMDMARSLAELEDTVGRHDEEIRAAFEAIRTLLNPPPEERKGRIGFR